MVLVLGTFLRVSTIDTLDCDRVIVLGWDFGIGTDDAADE